MEPSSRHEHSADVSFDGGDLDCGNGLLLLIRRHIDPLDPASLLEIRSTEPSVEEDLPAWCRLTSNELVSWTRDGDVRSFLVSKGPFEGRAAAKEPPRVSDPSPLTTEVFIPEVLPSPSPSIPIAPLSVVAIGSWPRPRWMVDAVHQFTAGRLSKDDFVATSCDAVRLCVQAQERAGMDVLSDGEQRRDSYASFVGRLLQNTQLIPLTDLLSMVDDPEKFEEELRALDVPAHEVRHPVAFGRIGRQVPLVLDEWQFAQSLTSHPVKVALPGPYLLTRTMWLDCLLDRAYESREELGEDIVRVLREELHFLLAEGVPLIQFDEPVLTEVVFTGSKNKRSFMCGALSERGSAEDELAFALQLMNRVTEGLPKERVALHVCRGNWTRDEGALLSGDYTPLSDFLARVNVGTLFLEFSTPRAGEIEALQGISDDVRIGMGVVNPRISTVESPDEIVRRAEAAIKRFGADRVLLNTDCGFATFADNPVAEAEIARRKVASLAQASSILKANHSI